MSSPRQDVKDAALLQGLEVEQRAMSAQRAYLVAYGDNVTLRQYADACAAIRQDLERAGNCPKKTYFLDGRRG